MVWCIEKHINILKIGSFSQELLTNTKRKYKFFKGTNIKYSTRISKDTVGFLPKEQNYSEK